MKILMVGVGKQRITFLERLIYGLAVRGITVTLAVPSLPQADIYRHENIKMLWLPSWEVNNISRLINLFRLLATRIFSSRSDWLIKHVFSQISIIKKFKTIYKLLPFTIGEWDIIYFAWNATAIDYSELFELGIPTIVSCRGSHLYIRPLSPEAYQYIKGLEKSLKEADAVHGVSMDILLEAQQYGLDPSKGHVIYPAVDPSFYSPSSSKRFKTSFTVLMVGSLIWRKGYEYALKSISIMKSRGIDVNLEIIGVGSDLKRIQYTIRDLGLSENVVLCGKLSPESVLTHLQNSDVFLHTAVSEAFCNAVLEAQSTGVPVVTTDANGLKENVVDGITGYIVPSRNPDAIADALCKLAADPQLRDRMGVAARQRVLEDFNLENYIDNWIDLFRKAVTREK